MKIENTMYSAYTDEVRRWYATIGRKGGSKKKLSSEEAQKMAQKRWANKPGKE